MIYLDLPEFDLKQLTKTAGSVTVIIGGSGSGKTTILNNIIHGLLCPAKVQTWYEYFSAMVVSPKCEVPTYHVCEFEEKSASINEVYNVPNIVFSDDIMRRGKDLKNMFVQSALHAKLTNLSSVTTHHTIFGTAQQLQNVTYLIFTRKSTFSAKKHIWSQWFTFLSEEVFFKMYDKYTKDFGVLVLDVEEAIVYHYKASLDVPMYMPVSQLYWLEKLTN